MSDALAKHLQAIQISKCRLARLGGIHPPQIDRLIGQGLLKEPDCPKGYSQAAASDALPIIIKWQKNHRRGRPRKDTNCN